MVCCFNYWLSSPLRGAHKKKPRTTHHHRSAQFYVQPTAVSAGSPLVVRRLFEVNSEPHTGARPWVRLCVGLKTASWGSIPKWQCPLGNYLPGLLLRPVMKSENDKNLRPVLKSAEPADAVDAFRILYQVRKSYFLVNRSPAGDLARGNSNYKSRCTTKGSLPSCCGPWPSCCPRPRFGLRGT